LDRDHPAYYVALSLVNVAGFTMYIPPKLTLPLRSPQVIDRPHLLLPEIAVESVAAPVDTIVRPLLDLLWNACGYLRSPNFREDGTWNAIQT
jgi:hypothetical protein